LAVNPALLDPAETVTDAGTLTDPLPLLNPTLIGLAAVAVKYTVQESVAGGVRLDCVQARLESVGVAVGLFRVSVKFLELPFKLAASSTEPLALTAVGALAVNTALLAPTATVTDAGTLTDGLPLDSVTIVALAAALLRFTAHDDVAGGVRLGGAHVRLDSETVAAGWLIVMVVPVPEVPMVEPLPSDAEAPAREIMDEVLVVPAEI
jgi:hypothetical protein